MKSTVFILTMFFCVSLNAQLTLTYNPLTNTIVSTLDECNSCFYPNSSDLNSCSCRRDCERDYFDCMRGCVDASNGIGTLVMCESECSSRRSSCKSNCGDINLQSPIESMTFSFAEVIGPLGIGPFSNLPGVITLQSDPTTIELDRVEIPDGFPSDFFVAAFNSPSQTGCIILDLTVTFQDGRSCMFTGTICP